MHLVNCRLNQPIVSAASFSLPSGHLLSKDWFGGEERLENVGARGGTKPTLVQLPVLHIQMSRSHRARIAVRINAPASPRIALSAWRTDPKLAAGHPRSVDQLSET